MGGLAQGDLIPGTEHKSVEQRQTPESGEYEETRPVSNPIAVGNLKRLLPDIALIVHEEKIHI